MSHIFLEFKDIDPGVKTVNDLTYELKDDSKETVFVISPEVVQFVRQAIDFKTAMGKPITDLKNCCFAFDDGKECFEIDSKGKLKTFSDTVPDWLPSKPDFMRSNWLENHELHDLITPEFIKAFLEKFPSVKERRDHANYLFDLQLDKIKGSPVSVPQPASKVGNKNSRTTKPRVHDLGSYEIFEQFFMRLKEAVTANQLPDLQVLTGMDGDKAPANLRSGVRTWFKGITGDLPANNKKLEAITKAGTEDLYCAPIRSSLEEVERIGLEKFYQALSHAIKDYQRVDEPFITDFQFDYDQTQDSMSIED